MPAKPRKRRAQRRQQRAASSPNDALTLTPLRMTRHTPWWFIPTYLPWLLLLGWLSAVTWFLCDDAYIGFRYVRNLVEGHGLVFNPGEYVEGYTNFLWLLELAALWALTGIPPEYTARFCRSPTPSARWRWRCGGFIERRLCRTAD